MTNLRSLLDDHESSIVERITSLHAQLVPLERELMEVRLAKAALKKGQQEPEQQQFFLGHLPNKNLGIDSVDKINSNKLLPEIDRKSPYIHLTIKDLIKKALEEFFIEGATANELLDLFSNAWGRTDIARTSLSPQLSRLRKEGVLFRVGTAWHLKATFSSPVNNEKTAVDQ